MFTGFDPECPTVCLSFFQVSLILYPSLANTLWNHLRARCIQAAAAAASEQAKPKEEPKPEGEQQVEKTEEEKLKEAKEAEEVCAVHQTASFELQALALEVAGARA